MALHWKFFQIHVIIFVFLKYLYIFLVIFNKQPTKIDLKESVCYTK